MPTDTKKRMQEYLDAIDPQVGVSAAKAE
jgi:hypothetical protein